MTRAELLKQWGISAQDQNYVGSIIRKCHILYVPKERIPYTYEWIGRCYSTPQPYEQALEALNEICSTHGVEYISHPEELLHDLLGYYYHDLLGYYYLNVGKSYAPTICYGVQKERFFVACMADLVEKVGM